MRTDRTLRQMAVASVASIALLLVAGAPAHAAQPAGAIHTAVPDAPETGKIHVIYLHGRIVENAGPRPTSERYGLYDYPAVLEALGSRGAEVISAQRPSGTDMDAYAGVVVSQVETLIERGVPAGNIVVVGFSKGGGIATRASSFLRRPEVRFVLLAACPDRPVPPNIRLTGRVFSIYEASDELAGTCAPLADQSERPASFEETRVSTGKAHGAFYLPLPAWTEPVLDWIHRGNG